LKDDRWSVIVEAGPLLLKGLWTSWALTIIALLVGLPAGIGLALCRVSRMPAIRWPAAAFVEVVRATPQLLVIFWVFFALPAVLGSRLPPWPAAIVSLSAIASAYLAEVVRGGLASVPRVLVESGFATGLGRVDILRFIVLPRALQVMIPAIVAHFVMLFKITSLIYIVGIIDLFRAVVLINNRVYEPVPLYATMAAIYFVCCYGLSRLVRLFDSKAALES
jgi:His/Glu/Gln/Arg/opine family amino acid ABC transporter permease subunit